MSRSTKICAAAVLVGVLSQITCGNCVYSEERSEDNSVQFHFLLGVLIICGVSYKGDFSNVSYSVLKDLGDILRSIQSHTSWDDMRTKVNRLNMRLTCLGGPFLYQVSPTTSQSPYKISQFLPKVRYFQPHLQRTLIF